MSIYFENYRTTICELLERSSKGCAISNTSNQALSSAIAAATTFAAALGSVQSIVDAADSGTSIAQQTKIVTDALNKAVGMMPATLKPVTLPGDKAYSLFNRVFNASLRVSETGKVTHAPFIVPLNNTEVFKPVYRALLVDAARKSDFSLADAETFDNSKPKGDFVALLLITPNDEYKKWLVTFSDWLSAPVTINAPHLSVTHMGLSKFKSALDALIYAACLVDKLTTLINRQRANNALISDELVSQISNACRLANEAVAKSLAVLTTF